MAASTLVASFKASVQLTKDYNQIIQYKYMSWKSISCNLPGRPLVEEIQVYFLDITHFNVSISYIYFFQTSSDSGCIFYTWKYRNDLSPFFFLTDLFTRSLKLASSSDIIAHNQRRCFNRRLALSLAVCLLWETMTSAAAASPRLLLLILFLLRKGAWKRPSKQWFPTWGRGGDQGHEGTQSLGVALKLISHPWSLIVNPR